MYDNFIDISEGFFCRFFIIAERRRAGDENGKQEAEYRDDSHLQVPLDGGVLMER